MDSVFLLEERVNAPNKPNMNGNIILPFALLGSGLVFSFIRFLNEICGKCLLAIYKVHQNNENLHYANGKWYVLYFTKNIVRLSMQNRGSDKI